MIKGENKLRNSGTKIIRSGSKVLQKYDPEILKTAYEKAGKDISKSDWDYLIRKKGIQTEIKGPERKTPYSIKEDPMANLQAETAMMNQMSNKTFKVNEKKAKQIDKRL